MEDTYFIANLCRFLPLFICPDDFVRRLQIVDDQNQSSYYDDDAIATDDLVPIDFGGPIPPPSLQPGPTDGVTSKVNYTNQSLTLQSIFVTFCIGLVIGFLCLFGFGLAIYHRNPNVAPRCTARPKNVIYKRKAEIDDIQYRGNPFTGWMSWVLDLSYDTLLRGVPGTGTRRGGVDGRMLSVNLDGIVLLRYHHLGYKVALLSTFLCMCIVLPINLTAQCYNFNTTAGVSEFADECRNPTNSSESFTTFERTTLANIPPVTNTTDDITPSLQKLRDLPWYGYPYSRTLVRLYFIALCSWAVYLYTCKLLRKEWKEILALRRVYYLQNEVWLRRRQEVMETVHRRESKLFGNSRLCHTSDNSGSKIGEDNGSNYNDYDSEQDGDDYSSSSTGIGNYGEKRPFLAREISDNRVPLPSPASIPVPEDEKAREEDQQQTDCKHCAKVAFRDVDESIPALEPSCTSGDMPQSHEGDDKKVENQILQPNLGSSMKSSPTAPKPSVVQLRNNGDARDPISRSLPTGNTTALNGWVSIINPIRKFQTLRQSLLNTASPSKRHLSSFTTRSPNHCDRVTATTSQTKLDGGDNGNGRDAKDSPQCHGQQLNDGGDNEAGDGSNCDCNCDSKIQDRKRSEESSSEEEEGGAGQFFKTLVRPAEMMTERTINMIKIVTGGGDNSPKQSATKSTPFKERYERREMLARQSKRMKDPWIFDPEVRETVPNIELYSVLVRNIPTLPSEIVYDEEGGGEFQMEANDVLEWQLDVVSSFFDQCVPNQPGFTSSVAAVTILPEAKDLALAWRKWYAAASALRRLRLIRNLIAQRLADLEDEDSDEYYESDAEDDQNDSDSDDNGNNETRSLNNPPKYNDFDNKISSLPEPGEGQVYPPQYDEPDKEKEEKRMHRVDRMRKIAQREKRRKMKAHYESFHSAEKSRFLTGGGDGALKFEALKESRKIFGYSDNLQVEETLFEALHYGPEQSAVYAREFAQGAFACCPFGCNEEKLRAERQLDVLFQMEIDAVQQVHSAHVNLQNARQKAASGAINVDAHVTGSPSGSPHRSLGKRPSSFLDIEMAGPATQQDLPAALEPPDMELDSNRSPNLAIEPKSPLSRGEPSYFPSTTMNATINLDGDTSSGGGANSSTERQIAYEFEKLEIEGNLKRQELRQKPEHILIEKIKSPAKDRYAHRRKKTMPSIQQSPSSSSSMKLLLQAQSSPQLKYTREVSDPLSYNEKGGTQGATQENEGQHVMEMTEIKPCDTLKTSGASTKNISDSPSKYANRVKISSDSLDQNQTLLDPTRDRVRSNPELGNSTTSSSDDPILSVELLLCSTGSDNDTNSKINLDNDYDMKTPPRSNMSKVQQQEQQALRQPWSKQGDEEIHHTPASVGPCDDTHVPPPPPPSDSPLDISPSTTSVTHARIKPSTAPSDPNSPSVRILSKGSNDSQHVRQRSVGHASSRRFSQMNVRSSLGSITYHGDPNAFSNSMNTMRLSSRERGLTWDTNGMAGGGSSRQRGLTWDSNVSFRQLGHFDSVNLKEADALAGETHPLMLNTTPVAKVLDSEGRFVLKRPAKLVSSGQHQSSTLENSGHGSILGGSVSEDRSEHSLLIQSALSNGLNISRHSTGRVHPVSFQESQASSHGAVHNGKGTTNSRNGGVNSYPASEQWKLVEEIRRRENKNEFNLMKMIDEDAGVEDDDKGGKLNEGVWNKAVIQKDIGTHFTRAKYCFTHFFGVTKHLMTHCRDGLKNDFKEKTSFAVVTFTNRQAAVAARHCLADGRGEHMWEADVSLPVPPLADSVPFDFVTCRGCCKPITISINRNHLLVRRTMAILCLAFVYVFYTFIFAFISGLVTPASLRNWFPNFEAKNNELYDAVVVFLGFLPAALQTLALALAPFLFKMIANSGSGATSQAGAEGKALEYYWWFILVSAFSANSIATAVINTVQFGQLQETATDLLIFLGNTIPTQISFVWLNWIIIRFTMILPNQYLLQLNTWLFQILGWNCCKRMNSGGMNGPELPYRIYVDSGTVFLCIVGLGFASPLVAPAALFYYLIAVPLLRRNSIFIYRPKYDGGGFRWPYLFDVFISSMCLGQILLAIMFLLKQAPGPAIVAIFPFAPTLVFRNRCRRRFLKAFQDAGLLQMSLLDEWDTSIATSPQKRDEYLKFLVDAHKAAYVPVCIAGDTVNVLTSAPAKVVPVEHDEILPEFAY